MKKQLNSKIVNRIYVFFVLLGIAVIILASTNPYEKDVRLNTGSFNDYGSGWERSFTDGSKEEVSLPYYSVKSSGSTISVTKKMGTEAHDGNFLLLRAVHTAVEVKVSGKAIYSYGDHMSKLFPIPGSAWLVVPMQDGYAGQMLTIDVSSVTSKYSGSMGKIFIGDRSGVLFYIIRINFVGLLTCILIFFFSLVMFIGWLMTRKQFKNNNLLYLSLFELAIFVWSSNEAQVTQFLFGDSQVIAVMTYEILMLLPMPLLAYYAKSEYPEVRKICGRVELLPIVNFLVCNILHFTGIFFLGDTLVITHACILIEAGFAVYGHVKTAQSFKHDRRKGNTASTIGFIFLVTMLAADIIRYYFTEHYGDSSLCSRIGLLVYVVSLATGTMRNGFGYMLGARQAEIYRQLAYTDNLTGLGNRQAYEEGLRAVEKDQDRCRHLIAVMIDLNNLKQTNDMLGHAEGDRYIMESSNYIRECFKDIAKTYRIGGDEFAVIYTGNDSRKFYEAERELLSYSTDEHSTRINFSYGSAEFDEAIDRSPEDTFHRADEEMYNMKREYKEKINSNP